MNVIEETLSGSVLTLSLQRQHKRNAMNGELVARLLQILAQLEGDSSVRALLVVGAGGGFCAGSDLAELAQGSSAQRAAFEHDSGLAARKLVECSRPVIAAVHGFAIGGGLTLATSCDVVITDALSRWSLPEVPIGLFPAWGLGSVASRIGLVHARRLCFGVDTLDGTAAVRIGLADSLAEQPLEAARELAVKLAKLPPSQTAAVKRFFADAASFEAADRRANDFFMQTTESAEAQALFEDFRRKAARTRG